MARKSETLNGPQVSSSLFPEIFNSNVVKISFCSVTKRIRGSTEYGPLPIVYYFISISYIMQFYCTNIHIFRQIVS